jgi:integrase
MLVRDRRSVERLVDKLYARMTPGSVKTIVQALTDYSQWLVACGELDAPRVSVQQDAPHGNPRKPLETYSAAEVEALLGAARGVSLRFWAYLSTVAYTGRRANEVLGLRWDQLQLDADGGPQWALPVQKNGRPQVLPLSARLVETVWTPANVATLKARGVGEWARDASAYPFPWNYSTPRKVLVSLCKRADMRYLGLHGFRRTFATRKLAAGSPPHAIASLLGQNVSTLLKSYDGTSALNYRGYLD